MRVKCRFCGKSDGLYAAYHYLPIRIKESKKTIVYCRVNTLACHKCGALNESKLVRFLEKFELLRVLHLSSYKHEHISESEFIRNKVKYSANKV